MICAYCNEYKIHSFYTPDYCSKTCFYLGKLRESKMEEREWKSKARETLIESTYPVSTKFRWGNFVIEANATVSREQFINLAWRGLQRS